MTEQENSPPAKGNSDSDPSDSTQDPDFLTRLNQQRDGKRAVAPESRTKISPRFAKGCGCLLVYVVGATFLGLLFLVQVPYYLLFGWIHYLADVLPSVQVVWPAISTGLLALAGSIVGIHMLGRWFARRMQPAVPWPWARSLRASVIVILMFAAGIAMVGLTHQVAWLATTSKSLVYHGSLPPVWRARSLLQSEVNDQGDPQPVLRALATYEQQFDDHDIQTWIAVGPNGRVALIAVAAIHDEKVMVSPYVTVGDQVGSFGSLPLSRESFHELLHAANTEDAEGFMAALSAVTTD